MTTKSICYYCSNYQEEFYPEENHTENSCDILNRYCYHPSSISYACPHFRPEESFSSSTAYCLALIEIKFNRLQAIRRKENKTMKLTTIQAHFEYKTRRCIISDAINECALYCCESGCQGCCCARVIRYLHGTLTLTKHELSLICGRKYGRLCACPLQPGTISTPES